MRVVKLSPWLVGLALLLGPLVQAQAEVTSDRAGSIVIYPKVIADGTRDTLIQLTNTSNSTVYVECEYVNGAGVCSGSGDPCTIGAQTNSECGGGETCDPAILASYCAGEDFGPLVLTRQQPTIWRVSTGRRLDQDDDDVTDPGACSPASPGGPQDCPGIDPGTSIPAQGPIFRGELKCVQVTMGGDPVGGNALKGEAIIETLGSNQISKYNSINVIGIQPDSDFAFQLDNSEYNACPAGIQFTHFASGADDPVAEGLGCASGDCSVSTEIALVPCTQDLESAIATIVPLQVVTTDEFESQISAPFILECIGNFNLDQINPAFDTAGGFVTFRNTRIFTMGSNVCRAGDNRNLCIGGANDGDACNAQIDCPGGRCRTQLCDDNADCGAGGVCGPPSGVLGVAEEFHDSPNSSVDGSAAQNLHMIGQRLGQCSGSLAACTSSAACDCLLDTITFHDIVP